MRQYLINHLTHLASLSAQRRWLINGTRDSYLVPEQLLEDAFVVADFALSSDVSNVLPPGAQSAFARLSEFASQVLLDGISNEALVESNTAWSHLRGQAQVCLAALEFDLAQWEASEGLRHGCPIVKPDRREPSA